MRQDDFIQDWRGKCAPRQSERNRKIERLARLYLCLPPRVRTICVPQADPCQGNGEMVADRNRARVSLTLQGWSDSGGKVYVIMLGGGDCNAVVWRLFDCPITFDLDHHYTLCGLEVWGMSNANDGVVSVAEVLYAGQPSYCEVS